eukprot:scaffold8129_cov363-Prasinococcus_capsulatus_cf.AAC.2
MGSWSGKGASAHLLEDVVVVAGKHRGADRQQRGLELHVQVPLRVDALQDSHDGPQAPGCRQNALVLLPGVLLARLPPRKTQQECGRTMANVNVAAAAAAAAAAAEAAVPLP